MLAPGGWRAAAPASKVALVLPLPAPSPCRQPRPPAHRRCWGASGSQTLPAPCGARGKGGTLPAAQVTAWRPACACHAAQRRARLPLAVCCLHISRPSRPQRFGQVLPLSHGGGEILGAQAVAAAHNHIHVASRALHNTDGHPGGWTFSLDSNSQPKSRPSTPCNPCAGISAGQGRAGEGRQPAPRTAHPPTHLQGG